MRIGINGFGRIGRCFMRAHSLLPDEMKQQIKICAINSTTDVAEDLIHLVKYDSTHGVWDEVLSGGGGGSDDKEIVYNGDKVALLKCSSPGEIPWSDYGVDLVLESSGKFNAMSDAIMHVGGSVRRVIVSAPSKGCQNNIIVSVNDDTLRCGVGRDAKVLSMGSCTTNCVVPLAYHIHSKIGIESGFMTTIHSYTNDQNLLDSRHKDRRRARSAVASMIPTSTGATSMIGEIVEELKGKIEGTAVRVPTQNVSMIDFAFTSKRRTTVDDILSICGDTASKYPDVVAVNREELVSVDFNHTKYSAIFDATQTHVIDGRFCRIAAWYDNEWGFVNRILDVMRMLVAGAN